MIPSRPVSSRPAPWVALTAGVALAAWVTLAGWASPAHAEEQPAKDMPVRSEDPAGPESEASIHLAPWAPAVLEDGDLTLLAAVEQTLGSDPAIRLQAADVAFQLGLEQEARGLFDWTLTGEAFYEHEELELRESVRRREQERRDDLRRLQGETCTGADADRAKITELEAAIATVGGVAITNDAIFDAELRALETLIQNATPSEAEFLLNERSLRLNQELAETIASRDANDEACAESTALLGRIGETPEREDFDTAGIDLRLEKLFRSGLFFAPFVDADYEATQYLGKRNGFFEPVLDDTGQQVVDFGIPRERFVDFGGKNIPDLYTVRVGFDFNVPLLRGSGAEEVAATERAAAREVEATRHLLAHVTAERVLETVLAYWDLRAAEERVELLEASVKRQRTIVDYTDDLIAGDELIPAERARADAGLARAETALSAARREVVATRLALTQVLGVAAPSEVTVPRAASEFPAPPQGAAVRALADEAERLVVARRRADLEAARAFLEASELRVAGARLATRDRLDLALRLWATAVGEDSFSNATDQWQAPSYRVAASYEKIYGNNEREGRLAQAQALAQRDRIDRADLERTIGLATRQALGELAEAVERLGYAERASAGFVDAYSAEETNFGALESTLLDLIVTEEQQTEAGLAAIDARLEIAGLLARLRFETGTLIASDASGYAVESASLTALPSPSSSRLDRSE
ncbi:MAG: TolC family protein [Acidobacteriota bacterium]